MQNDMYLAPETLYYRRSVSLFDEPPVFDFLLLLLLHSSVFLPFNGEIV